MPYLHIQPNSLIAACLLFALFLPTLAHASVFNSVSVQAIGGESSASVKTVINGEVVEDRTIEGDGSIISTHIINNETDTRSDVVSEREEEIRATLEHLMKELHALLQKYVLLLSTKE